MVNGYVNISERSSKIIGDFLSLGDAPTLNLEDQALANELIELSKISKILVLGYKNSMNYEGNAIDFNLNLTLNSVYASLPGNVGTVITGAGGQFQFTITADTAGNVAIARSRI